MFNFGILLACLGIILISAEFFTNGVEWLGRKMHLSEGAVGSVLAAVGTALPETLIPVIAITMGCSEAATDIGIGAILGAPFMLGTLALFVTGAAALFFAFRGRRRVMMSFDPVVMRRDLRFFLAVYSAAILASAWHTHLLKELLAVGLVAAYAWYVYQNLRSEGVIEEEGMGPLIMARGAASPGLGIILLQVGLALAGIVLGADVFVQTMEKVAFAMKVPAFVLSIIVTPIATELPEKFNSVLWVRRGKDTLALGNITGAMVFQSSIIPALGIALTPWHLTATALTSALLVLLSATVVYLMIEKKKQLKAYHLLTGGLFYALFLIMVFTGPV